MTAKTQRNEGEVVSVLTNAWVGVPTVRVGVPTVRVGVPTVRASLYLTSFLGEFVGPKVRKKVAGRWSETEPPVIQSYIQAP